MNTTAAFRVFLSAVTTELAACRLEIAPVLRRKRLEVCEQEHSTKGPAPAYPAAGPARRLMSVSPEYVQA
jgi:hypothetical protein